MKTFAALPLACSLTLSLSAVSQTVAPAGSETQQTAPKPLSAPAPNITPAAAAEAQTAKGASGAVEAARPATPNTLMDGTPISLRLSETISSEDAKVGQSVPFEVTEDVLVQGLVVIAKGSPALGTVTTAEPKKRMGRGGKLDVNIDSVRLVDGSKVQLSATKNTSGGGHVGVMTTAMVGTAIVFFPAAPLFLLMHGKDITIPKGTPITSFVQGDTRLDMARLSGQPGSATPGTVAGGAGAPASGSGAVATLIPVSGSAAMATLQIDSNTPGADIEIDGAFAGNTPSTLTVTPGQHTIAVKKKGYADWNRTMNVSGSAVHVNAELEQSN